MLGGMGWLFIATDIYNNYLEPSKKIIIINEVQAYEDTSVETSETTDTPVVESTNSEGVQETPEETIRRVAKEANYPDADLLVKIAHCESTMNPNAQNGSSTATGIFQYLKGTWEDGNRRTGHNWALEDRYDVEKSTRMTIWWITRGYLSKWNASKGCWG